MTAGILPDREIDSLFRTGALSTEGALDADQIQPASLDLRLGRVAYRVRAGFMPGSQSSVMQKLEALKLHEIDLTQSAVLETGCVYIVPLLERLALPDDVQASTNPKSSTGRLDIFTRVLTDNSVEFDKVAPGYRGGLYLEVSPRTFPIVVREGSRLSQIRFRQGRPILDGDALLALHEKDTLVTGGDANITSGGIAVSVDLSGDENGLVGFRGKRHTAVVDVDKRDANAVHDFWEPLHLRQSRQIILDPDEFYILVSKEAVHVPPDYAAEMTPFDPLVGEFRVHYAGFFDPGFGHALAGGIGSRAVLEVRSHDVPFVLEDGQLVGRLVYEHMSSRPEKLYGIDLKSNYQAQGLKLSKHFKEYDPTN
ncbi:MAG: 2'-deoxycytidine 5'-triphosphate deaminase [Pseudomonadota bacterium]